MCGKTTTTNTQSSSQPPQQVLQAYNQLLQGTGAYPGAMAIAGTPYQPYTGEMVAPVNAQQTAGIGGINQYAGGINQYASAAQPSIALAQNAITNYATPLYGGAGQVLEASQPILTPDQIMTYYNPYQQQVIDTTQKQLADFNARQQQQVTGNAVSQGALGGDRPGVAAAILAGQQATNEAPVISGLEQQGYNQALATAAQQYQQNQQAVAYEAANLAQGFGNQASNYANLGLVGQQAGLTGQQAGLTAAQTQMNAGQVQQMTQQAQDTAAQTAYWQQQGYPFQVAAWLANIAVGSGSALGGTSQSSTTQPAPFFGLSDERAKEDISKVGQTKDGQNLYRYRFKGSPEWHIGLLAQEVEKKHPEAVADIGGGYKGVDVKGATDDSTRKGYALGGMPLGVGSLAPGSSGVPFGPLDPSMLGSGGLGQTLGVNSQVRGAGPPQPKVPTPQKPQTAMDMFKQASDMANAGKTIGTGAEKAGNFLSSSAADMGIGNGVGSGGYNFIDAAAGSGPVGTAAELGDTIGPGLGATADLGAAATDAALAGGTAVADAGATAADLLPLLLVQSGGRINRAVGGQAYPGGLALPRNNRIQLPMRAGMGMPTFVKGYEEGGAPMVVGAGDPTALSEQARQNQLTAQEYFGGLNPQQMTERFGGLSSDPEDVINQPLGVAMRAALNESSEPSAAEQEAEARSVVSRFGPGAGNTNLALTDPQRVQSSVPPRALAYDDTPRSVGATYAPPSGGYQAAPRTTVRPQLAGGPEEGPLGMSKDFWYSALAGVASALASPSPFAGVAIGQGLLGGLGAYSGLKKGEANIEMEAQRLDQAAKAEQDRLQHENDVLAQQRQFHETMTPYEKEQIRIHEQQQQLQELQPVKIGQDIMGRDVYGVRDPKTGMYRDPGTGQPIDPKRLYTPTQGGDGSGGKIGPLGGRDESMAQQIAHYQVAPPSTYAAARPNSPAAMWLARANEISMEETGEPYDQTQYGARSKIVNDFAGGGKHGDKVTFFNNSVQHLGTLDNLVTALGNGDFNALNALKNTFKNQFGSEMPGNFEAAKQIVGQEIIKSIVANGGGEREREEAAAQLSAAKSPQQLRGIINTYLELSGAQLRDLKLQYEQGSHNKDFNRFLIPESQQELAKVEARAAARNAAPTGPTAKPSGPPEPGAKFSGGKWWRRLPNGDAQEIVQP